MKRFAGGIRYGGFSGFLQRYETQISYAIALILGAAAFQLFFDARVFMQLDWGLDGPNDLAQHMTGYYALRAAPWSLPLMWTEWLWSPQGINAYFTDSIPLLAISTKLFAPFLPPNFHPFKIGLAAVYLLQPVCAVALIRAAGRRSIPAAFFAAAFSLLVKWFLFRFGHVALNAQFVLLLALALYLRLSRLEQGGKRARSVVLGWLLLLLLAFLIHMYTLAMVFGVFAAAVVDGRYPWLSRKSAWLYRANLLLLAGLLLTCAYALVVGLDTLRGMPPVDGYGFFSLNLSGPFFGGNIFQLPTALGPSIGQVYEDQSYLGLGILIMLAAALIVDGKNLLRRVGRSPAFCLVMLGLFVFALSSDVYLGQTRVFHYPDWLAQPLFASPLVQLRASARFFWPVGYALLFWGLAVLLRRRWAAALLVCLLFLQWADLPKPLSPRPAGYAAAFNPDLPAWDRLFQSKRALYLYPTYPCGGDEDLIGLPAILSAARNGVKSNTSSVSRFVDDCPLKAAQGLADLTPGTVHVFTRPAEYADLLQEHPDWCAARAELMVCIPDPNGVDRAFLAGLDELSLPKKASIYGP